MRIAIYKCDNVAEKLKEVLSEVHEVTVIQQISSVTSEYDYVIIATYDVQQSAEIFEMLVGKGIPSDVILEYCNFEKYPVKSAMELFLENGISSKSSRYVLGMSHAFGGISEYMLAGKVYKLAAPSMDLYYHQKVLHELFSRVDARTINQIILELPYYIFNYDVSLCKKTFPQRMNFYYFFSDYHHYGEDMEGQHQIAMFEKLNRLFPIPPYRTIEEIQMGKARNSAIRKQYRKMRCAVNKKREHLWTEKECEEAIKFKPHVWYQERNMTIKENLLIWEQMKKELDSHTGMDWKVVVFPFAPIFIENHREAIWRMRAMFYDNIQLPQEKIIDCFEYYEDKPEYFSDICHLNEKGCYEFSKVFDKLVMSAHISLGNQRKRVAT